MQKLVAEAVQVVASKPPPSQDGVDDLYIPPAAVGFAPPRGSERAVGHHMGSGSGGGGGGGGGDGAAPVLEPLPGGLPVGASNHRNRHQHGRDGGGGATQPSSPSSSSPSATR